VVTKWPGKYPGKAH